MSALDDAVAQLHSEGWAIVPGVLDRETLAVMQAALDDALRQAREEGQILFREGVDPNDRNERVVQLLGRHPIFADVVVHPTALVLVDALLGEHYLLSSLSANIARPGSGSMKLHNDLMAVLPEPWLAPYGVNILFYLDDTDATNGATRYLPGSHRFTSGADAPSTDLRGTKPLEAPAGSFVAVDGRLWHTSGANHTSDRDRRVLISFYISSFIRTQYNWNALLADDVRAALSPRQRALLGLDDGNMAVRLGYDAFRDTKQGIDPHALAAHDR